MLVLVFTICTMFSIGAFSLIKSTRVGFVHNLRYDRMTFKFSPKRAFPFARAIFPLILSMTFLCGCSQTQTSDRLQAIPSDPLLRERSEKDAAFKSGENSPIVSQDRSGFQGLSYYAINPDLRFSVKLHRYPIPKQIRLGTNTGEIRSGLRYGYFEFQVESHICRLQVYKLEDAPDHGASLFIPFRDSTSGKETYGAGRYIDLKENTSGVYDLDFNRAYNPFCAYNSEFSCPFPPAENTLTVPIRAGEKKFSGGH
jgi:uncharacterized protein (DUF1684 family)